MPILVTDVGLKAIADADAGGFLVNLQMFAITSAREVYLTIADTALKGIADYSAKIKKIEPIGSATVKLTLEIPPGKPVEGQWSISEIGIYLKTGELFAHGSFNVPYVKTADYSLIMVVYVTAGRLAVNVNINVDDNTGSGGGVATASYVRMLQKPVESKQNVVAVMDQHVNEDGTSSASLAVKYGLNWSYLGYSRSFIGQISRPGPSSFFLDVETHAGFWLNHDEVVIIQITTGPGAGESRKAKFNKSTNVFSIIEKVLPELSVFSTVAIWRNTINTLPARLPEMPRHLVLGIGQNTWKKDVSTFVTGTLAMIHSSFIAKASNLYALTTAVSPDTLTSPGNFTVFVNGKAVAATSYSITTAGMGNLIFSVLPPIGSEIEVVYFDFIEGDGAETFLMETTTRTTEPTASFSLPIIPESVNEVLVFENGLIVSPSKYVFSPSSNSILFTTPVAADKEVSLMTFSSYANSGNNSSYYKQEFVASGTAVAFTTTALISDMKKSVVLVGGLLVSRDLYSITGADGIITFYNPPAAGTKVTIIVFQELMDPEVVTSTGIDTGPVWEDPAGVEGYPNTLVPKTKSHIADGIHRIYEIFPVTGKQYVLVFVDGIFQDPAAYTISGDKLTHRAVVPLGMYVDIICFTEIESAGGSSAVCKTVTTVTTSSKSYTIPVVAASADHVIVTVGGVYQHKGVYDINAAGTAVVFTDPLPIGEPLRIWIYRQVGSFGKRTNIYVDRHTTKSIQSGYRLSGLPASDENLLVFVSGVYQDIGSYGIGTGEMVLNTSMVGHGNLSLVTMGFVSQSPRTRLVLRSEYDTMRTGMLYDTDLLSADEGNSLELHDDGLFYKTVPPAISSIPDNLIRLVDGELYYGSTAPDDVASIYINADPTIGNDSNSGTRASPMRTLKAALARGSSGINRSIYLHEDQTHYVQPGPEASYFRGGSWWVTPYGPRVDALTPVLGDSPLGQYAAMSLNTNIKCRNLISEGNSVSGIYQNGFALFPTGGAEISVLGVNFICAMPDGSANPLSSYSGTFHHPAHEGHWYLRGSKITMPHAESYFYSPGKHTKASCTLAAIVFSGLGLFAHANSKMFTVDWWGGFFGAHGSTDTQFRKYLALDAPVSSHYATFNTNLLPDDTANYLLADSGFHRFPNGIIHQWGRGTIPGLGGWYVTFPVAFPSKVTSITLQKTSTDAQFLYIASQSLAGFTAENAIGAVNSECTYFATGY